MHSRKKLLVCIKPTCYPCNIGKKKVTGKDKVFVLSCLAVRLLSQKDQRPSHPPSCKLADMYILYKLLYIHCLPSTNIYKSVAIYKCNNSILFSLSRNLQYSQDSPLMLPEKKKALLSCSSTFQSYTSAIIAIYTPIIHTLSFLDGS